MLYYTRFAALVLVAVTYPAIAYDSNPSATHTLYLNFGEYQTSTYWPHSSQSYETQETGAPYTSPPLFPDGANPQMSATDKDDYIYRIWRRVAEDFSPLAVNVTTQVPSNLQSLINGGLAAHIAIGGEASDVGGSSAGAGGAYLDPTLEPTALVIGRGSGGTLRTVKQIARTISHEAAHMYGADYHYWKPSQEPSCNQPDTTELRNALMSYNPSGARDGWWSGLGHGKAPNGTTAICTYRADVAILRNALGERAPKSPPFDINPLRQASSSTLVGNGVIAYDNATYSRDQWVEISNSPSSCPPGQHCLFRPIYFMRLIGKGPNEWMFKASSNGSIRITVNTINRDRDPVDNSYIDDSSANLNADFSLFVANNSALSSWTRVVASANRVSGDAYSATYSYSPTAYAGYKTYVVSVNSRGEGYGELGQYDIEVYGGNGNVQVYAQTNAPKAPKLPTTPVVTPKVTPRFGFSLAR